MQKHVQLGMLRFIVMILPILLISIVMATEKPASRIVENDDGAFSYEFLRMHRVR